METRHVRLEYAQGLNGKKQILSSEISLICIARILLRYKMLRKKEFALKNQLKTSITALRTRLDLFSSMLPTVPSSSIMHKAVKKEIHETKESKDLSQELKDIQEKLARLQ
jgi:hypothetical protein